MNKEEVIALARQAGLGTALTHNDGPLRVWIEGADWHDELIQFANLVAAAEREACARVCDGWTHADGDQCAEAIRARKYHEH